jgi:hypothetical protein
VAAKTFTRFELAEAQFERAIDLYVRGDYVPAITLAGAAEELYGAPYALPKGKEKDDPRALQVDAGFYNMVHRQMFGDEHRKLFLLLNFVKNRLKHSDDKVDQLTFDPEDEAYWMIDRADRNRALEDGYAHPRKGEVDDHHVRALLSAESGRGDQRKIDSTDAG